MKKLTYHHTALARSYIHVGETRTEPYMECQSIRQNPDGSFPPFHASPESSSLPLSALKNHPQNHADNAENNNKRDQAFHMNCTPIVRQV